MRAELMRERVWIPAAGGSLAGELAYPFDDTLFATLIVNPHPHMGGRTGNTLLVRLAESLAADGGVVLSFDYSGVGESDGPRINVAESMSQFWRTGSAPEDPRMINDTGYALSWLAKATARPLIVLGYSFGAYAAAVAAHDDVAALVLISPTIKQHDFSKLRKRAVSKLIVYSEDDFATPQADLNFWLASLPQPLKTCCIPSGDHFFRGREDAVSDACCAFAGKLVEEGTF